MDEPKGLTLIEGLITGGIIVVLLFVTGMALSSARERARDYKRLSDVSRIQGALELFYNEQNQYPEAIDPISIGTQGSLCLSSAGFTASCPPTGHVFLNPVPTQTDIGLSGSDLGVYAYESTGDSYAISFMVEHDVAQTNIVEGMTCAYPGQAIVSSRAGVCEVE